jgi:hypothetical protein
VTITPLPTRLLPDTTYYNYVRRRRSIDPTRFDYYHPLVGTMIGLEISGIPTAPTTLVPTNDHFNAAADRQQYESDPNEFDTQQPILGALFQLESPSNGPPPTHLLPLTPQYNAMRVLYDSSPAQFPQNLVYFGAVIALENIENGDRTVSVTPAAQSHSTAVEIGCVHPGRNRTGIPPTLGVRRDRSQIRIEAEVKERAGRMKLV